MDDPDAELVRRARGGDEAAAAQLFRVAWPEAAATARAVAGSAASDDVAQTALLKAFRALPRFDGRRPFRAWLRRIVVNEALNVRRSPRRLAPLWPHVAAPPQPAPEGLGALWDAVAELSPDRRVVIGLRYGRDLTPDEIADALDVPVGTVKSRLARARRPAPGP